MEKKNLNESISSIVYHFTSIDACIDILESNKFFLTLSYGNKDEEGHDNRLFYMSTTRQANGYLGYQNYMDYSTRICLDGDKLNNNYKGAPFNYFRKQGKQKHIGSKLHDFSYQQRSSFDESEDRVWSYSPTINNAKKYIKEIDVYADNTDMIKKLSSFANEVTINLYNDPYDFKMKNKKFTVLEYSPSETSEIDYDKMEHSFRTYKYMLSYIVAIYCIYNGITSSNRIKDLVPKFDVASNINDDYEELEVLTKINNIISDVYANNVSVYSLTSMLKGYTEGSSSKTNDVALLLNLYNKFIRQNNLYNRQNLYNVMLKHISESKEIKTKNILNESLTSIVYHFTSLDACIKILATNKFKLGFSLLHNNESFGNRRLFFLCVTRMMRGDVGYSSENKVRIELDGDKLNQRYNSQPISFFHNKGSSTSVKGRMLKKSFPAQQVHHVNESEDRVYSDKPIIPNAKKYIKRIDVYGHITGNMCMLLFYLDKYSDGIDIRIYESRDSFNKRDGNCKTIKEILKDKKDCDKPIKISDYYVQYDKAFLNWLLIIALMIGKIDKDGNFLGNLSEIAKYLSKDNKEISFDETEMKNRIKYIFNAYKKNPDTNIFLYVNEIGNDYNDDRLNKLYAKISKVFSRLGVKSKQQIDTYIFNRIQNGETE